MTNAEKYQTAEERERAFERFCGGRDCNTCPLDKPGKTRGVPLSCRFPWLDLEAEEMTISEVADILAEHNKWRRGRGEYAEAGAKCNITPEELGTAIDRAVEILRNIKE